MCVCMWRGRDMYTSGFIIPCGYVWIDENEILTFNCGLECKRFFFSCKILSFPRFNPGYGKTYEYK